MDGPNAKDAKKMNNEEEDLYYYRAAFRSALLWSVITVTVLALIAWLL